MDDLRLAMLPLPVERDWGSVDYVIQNMPNEMLMNSDVIIGSPK